MCTQTFVAKDKNTYHITLSEDGNLITVSRDNKNLGTIGLDMRTDDACNTSYYHITHLDFEKCKSIGLGRESLLFHGKIFNTPITAASQYNPIQLYDGSHLTGEGVPFISKMRSEGIVCKDPDDLHNEMHFDDDD